MNCEKCKIELSETNWYKTHQRAGIYICKSCWNQRKGQSIRDNTKYREYWRNWQRRHKLTTSKGVVYGLNKRDYPEESRCEICNENKVRLLYHHWDDDNLNKGIYLCIRCHYVAEAVDKGIHIKYLRFKKKLDKEMYQM